MAIQQQTSLVPAFERLARFAALEANWDAAGASPPSPLAVATACLLIEAVAEEHERLGGPRLAPDTSVPIADGGLQIEWTGRAARIEVQIAPDGVLGYLIVRGTGTDVDFDEADDVAFPLVVQSVLGILAA
jgi:hypothetical protein